MRVTILDLDWYNKESFLPNEKCMKLSSYHQQLGDLINFPLQEVELNLEFDLYYIVRDSIGGKLPKGVNIKDERVKLIGNGFRFYDNYMKQVPDAVAACRPDYLLYPIREENRMSKANIIQLYNGNKRLEKIQDFDNAYTKVKYNLVVDKDFWGKRRDDIVKSVEFLSSFKNIQFKEPIKLSHLLYDEEIQELFLSLSYKDETKMPFLNDCPAEDNDMIIDFLCKYHDKYPNHKLPLIKMHALMYNHDEEPDKAIVDFEHCMQLIDRAKQYQFKIYIEAPPRTATNFWMYFEELECWCKYRFNSSFLEHMFSSLAFRYKVSVYELLYNRISWGSQQSQMFRDLYRHHPDIIEKYGLREMGNSFYPVQNLKKLMLGE